MPGCGEPGSIDPGYAIPLPIGGNGPFPDTQEDTNKLFVRDLQVDELEELMEKCVRRVLQGEDLKREWARLETIRKVVKP